MDTIDCKCGTCKNTFPVHKDTFKKRISNNTLSYDENQITCPSCQTRMPYALLQIVHDIVKADKLEGWNIGTNFPKDQ